VALKAAAEMMDSADRPQSILRLVIDNMIYPITLEVIHKVCHSILYVILMLLYNYVCITFSSNLI